MPSSPAPPARDPWATLETALAGGPPLRESQRRNARLKARDLRSGALEWESVPFRVIFESNRRCNLDCVFCDNDFSGTGELEPGVAERLFDEIGWGILEVLPFGAGEPTLSPIDRLAPLARRHNQYFNFITNGVLFTGDYYRPLADITGRVQFSLNSHTAAINRRISPQQDFELVVANVREAVPIAAETGAHLLLGLVVLDCNLDHLADYVRFAARLGVRRVLFSKLYTTSSLHHREGIEIRRSPAQIEDRALRALEVAIELGVTVETNLKPILAGARQADTSSSPFNLLHESADIVALFRPEFCISSAITVFVEWDGTVLPCFQSRIPLGNLYRTSFGELWNGEVMRAHRRALFAGERSPTCEACMEFFCGHS